MVNYELNDTISDIAVREPDLFICKSFICFRSFIGLLNSLFYKYLYGGIIDAGNRESAGGNWCKRSV